jgi:2,3-bisphosphoglycerate-dependent phosphoglycerate mutase
VVKNSSQWKNVWQFTGLNKAEIAKKYGTEQVEIWRRSYAICPPDGESFDLDRTVSYYKTEIEPNLRAGKKITLVTHGNSLRAVMMYLENNQRILKNQYPNWFALKI